MKHLLIIFAVLFCSSVFAQEKVPKFLNIELAGNAKHLSINYDSRFTPGIGGLGFRAGVGGTWSYYSRDKVSLNIPIGLNYLLGNKQHFAEMGLVAIPEYYFGTSSKNIFFSTNANLGYRYVSKSGIMLNALWTPQLTKDKNSSGFKNKNIWFGIGAGIKL